VPEAIEILVEEEANKLIDADKVVREGIRRVETAGIVFIDEIDKVSSRESPGHGPDVSREGVQRDLLPIIEGSTIVTKYGMVHTDHILFISAGATQGRKLFEGTLLSVRYFYDTLDMDLWKALLYRGLEDADDVLKHPEYLDEARRAGVELAGTLTGCAPDSHRQPAANATLKHDLQ
jgi:hypothetical protein